MKESTSALPFNRFYREIFAKRKKGSDFLNLSIAGPVSFSLGNIRNSLLH